MQETADGIAELRKHRTAGRWRGRQPGPPARPRRGRPGRDPGRQGAQDEGVEPSLDPGRPPGSDDAGRPGSSAEARDHAERRALENSQRAVVETLGVPSYELPLLSGASTSAGSTSSPDSCAPRAWREGPGMSTPRKQSRGAEQRQPSRTRTRVGPQAVTGGRLLDVDALLDDRGHRHHRVLRLGRGRQDHDLGGARAPGGRAGPQGGRPHHRPGAPARPVDGDRGARQHPATGAGRRRAGRAAASTR